MLEVGVPPWAFDIRGVAFGRALDEHTCHRLGLHVEEPDEYSGPDDGTVSWATPDGQFSVLVSDGLVGLVNFRHTAVLDGVELIGASLRALVRLIGLPTSHDGICGVAYCVGEWELFVGLDLEDEDRIAWLFVSHGDVLDGSEPDLPS